MKSKWFILAVTCLITGLVFLDNTVMPVALPVIQRDFNMKEISLVWVVNAYLLTFMTLMLIGGRLSDLLGTRKTYQLGLLIFALGSLVGALSYSSTMLIIGRIFQGVGAAFNTPATAALLLATFDGGNRGKAIGINTGISSVFLVLGPAVGGMVTEYLNWHYIFWFHLPLIAFAYVMVLFLVPKQKGQRGHFHLREAFWLALAIFSLVVGIMQGEEWGWISRPSLLCLVVGAFSFLFFLKATYQSPQPLIDRQILQQRFFRRSVICIFLTQFLVMATVFWAIFFQESLHFSPAETGFLIMFATMPVFFVAPIGGYLNDRIGPRVPIVVGFCAVFVSLILLGLSPLDEHSSHLPFLLKLLLYGCGIPLIFSPSVVTAMSEVPTAKLGGASAMTVLSRQFASTTGLAVMSALFYNFSQKASSMQGGFKVISLFAAGMALAGGIFAFFAFRNFARLENKKT